MSGGFGRGQILESDGNDTNSFNRSSNQMVKDFENMHPSGQSQQFQRNQDSGSDNYKSRGYDDNNFSRGGRGGGGGGCGEWRGLSNDRGGSGGYGYRGGRGESNSFGGNGNSDDFGNSGGSFRGGRENSRGGRGFSGGDNADGDNSSYGLSKGNFGNDNRDGFSRGGRGGGRREEGFGGGRQEGGFGGGSRGRSDDFNESKGFGRSENRSDDDNGGGNRYGGRSFSDRDNGGGRGGRGFSDGDGGRGGRGFSNGDSGFGGGGRGGRGFSNGDSYGGGGRGGRGFSNGDRYDCGGRGGRGFSNGDSGYDGGGRGGRGFSNGDSGYDGGGRGGRGFSNDGSGYDGGRGGRGGSFGGGGRLGSRDEGGGGGGGFSSNRSNAYGNDALEDDTFERKKVASFIPEDRALAEMYLEDAENAKYEVGDLDLDVTVTGIPETEAFYRIKEWRESGFSETLMRNIVDKACYKNLRRIQTVIIPLIKNGWDICGHAETGSGKTAAFVLPIIDNVMRAEPVSQRCAPTALILAPTRELVAQLYNQTRKFVEGTGVSVAKAYGQYRVMDNIMEIQRGCNILVATMGRLKDFVDREKIILSQVKFFVLDEADQMLSGDSFATDVMDIINRADFPPVDRRQTLLFSATFDADVQQLAKQMLKLEHAFVSNGRATAANSHVIQSFLQVSSNRKLEELQEMLMRDGEKFGKIPRTLVFVERKKTSDSVALYLSGAGLLCSSTNGDRDQSQREEALRNFRQGTIRVLVSTDVCARGIDVKDLEHVVNYDLPKDMITYVHRIGRTGRMHMGRSTTFIDIMGSVDRNLAPEIVKVVVDVQQVVPQFLRDLAEGGGGFSGTTGFSGSTGFSANSQTGFSANTQIGFSANTSSGFGQEAGAKNDPW